MWTWVEKIYHLCKEAKVDISYINNENDFAINFSRIDRNKTDERNSKTNGELSKEEFSILTVLKLRKMR